MKLNDLVIANRSYRRFDNEYKVNQKEMSHIIANLPYLASAANLQNLRYIVSNEKKINDEIFRCLNWAGYLADWPGPISQERPSAYIAIVVNNSVEKFAHYDAGISAQTITLSATEIGLGCCIIASINKPLLCNILNISEENYTPLLVVAIGKPKEQVKIEPVIDDNIQYWRDDKGLHHVPKRSLDDILIDKYWEES